MKVLWIFCTICSSIKNHSKCLSLCNTCYYREYPKTNRQNYVQKSLSWIISINRRNRRTTDDRCINMTPTDITLLGFFFISKYLLFFGCYIRKDKNGYKPMRFGRFVKWFKIFIYYSYLFYFSSIVIEKHYQKFNL